MARKANGTAGLFHAVSGAPIGWMERYWAPTLVVSTAGAYAARCRRCCAVHLLKGYLLTAELADISSMAFLPLDRHYRHERREILDVRDAFKNAGIKGATEFVCDANITSDAIVLWVGVRSPDEMGTFS